jgi:hypothetical protein
MLAGTARTSVPTAAQGIAPLLPALADGSARTGRAAGGSKGDGNEIAKALASELRIPERRVKRALVAVQRRRFEARLKDRLKMIRRSERRAQRIRERAR